MSLEKIKAEHSEMYYFIPSHVRSIMHTLYKNGNECSVVGGCVRDFFMGNVPHDYDLATDLLPEECMKLFEDEGYKTEPSGITYGTISVIVQGEAVEITTYRADASYGDGRRPDAVTYAKTIQEDLSRRDFTIGSISFSLTDGFVDPYNGREDIQKRVLRCVGNPVDRFSEDALRMLRGVRFACKYDLDMGNVDVAMYDCSHMIENVSMERYNDELFKILETRYSGRGVRFLMESGLLDTRFSVSAQRMENMLDLLDGVGAENKLHVGQAKFGLMCTMLYKPSENVAKFIEKFKISKKGTNVFTAIVQECSCFSTDTHEIKKQMARLRKSGADIRTFMCLKSMFYRDWQKPSVQLTINRNFGSNMTKLRDEQRAWYSVYAQALAYNEPLDRSDLAVNGNRIKEIVGFSDWKILKSIIEELVEVVHRDPSFNTQDILLNTAKGIYKRGVR